LVKKEQAVLQGGVAFVEVLPSFSGFFNHYTLQANNRHVLSSTVTERCECSERLLYLLSNEGSKARCGRTPQNLE